MKNKLGCVDGRVAIGASALAVVIGVAACDGGFSSENCRASHTCAVADAKSGEGGAAGEDAVLPSGGAGLGGTSATGGVPEPDGTAGSPTEGCLAAADCSNGDPSDGEEVCAATGDCQPGNAPPTVTAVVPRDEVTDADPDGAIAITFSEPLDAKTVTAETIKVLDRDSEVAGDLAYADGKVTFTPSVPLYMLEPYTVSVSRSVTDADGAGLLSDYSSSFTTRDGAWTTIDAVTEPMTGLADALPLSANGDALLAWTANAGAGCPATARRFRLGASNGDAQPFDASDTACAGVTAAGNADGIAAVAWQVPGAGAGKGELAQQLRNGAWQADNDVVTSDDTLLRSRVAVSPTGMLTIIAHNGSDGTTAWRTDARGKWVAAGDTLSAVRGLSAASIAFDAQGNGIAVWIATTATAQEILSSRYTTTSGKWSRATAIPDSGGGNPSTPFLAMTPEGDAMAVWMEAQGDTGTFVTASIFSRVSGWAADVYSMGPDWNVVDLSTTDPLGLAFDGQAFVIAWVAKPEGDTSVPCGAGYCTYTNRYDLKTSAWGSYLISQTKAADVAAPKMPRLASDGRGNLLMVWAKKVGTSTNSLVYQRYSEGEWSGITALPGGTVTDKNFATSLFPTLSMNASGMAAVSWGNADNNGLITGARLASFY